MTDEEYESRYGASSQHILPIASLRQGESPGVQGTDGADGLDKSLSSSTSSPAQFLSSSAPSSATSIIISKSMNPGALNGMNLGGIHASGGGRKQNNNTVGGNRKGKSKKGKDDSRNDNNNNTVGNSNKQSQNQRNDKNKDRSNKSVEIEENNNNGNNKSLIKRRRKAELQISVDSSAAAVTSNIGKSSGSSDVTNSSSMGPPEDTPYPRKVLKLKGGKDNPYLHGPLESPFLLDRPDADFDYNLSADTPGKLMHLDPPLSTRTNALLTNDSLKFDFDEVVKQFPSPRGNSLKTPHSMGLGGLFSCSSVDSGIFSFPDSGYRRNGGADTGESSQGGGDLDISSSNAGEGENGGTLRRSRPEIDVSCNGLDQMVLPSPMSLDVSTNLVLQKNDSVKSELFITE